MPGNCVTVEYTNLFSSARDWLREEGRGRVATRGVLRGEREGENRRGDKGFVCFSFFLRDGWRVVITTGLWSGRSIGGEDRPSSEVIEGGARRKARVRVGTPRGSWQWRGEIVRHVSWKIRYLNFGNSILRYGERTRMRRLLDTGKNKIRKKGDPVRSRTIVLSNCCFLILRRMKTNYYISEMAAINPSSRG